MMKPDPGVSGSSRAHAVQLDTAFESLVRRKPSLGTLTEDISLATGDVRIELARSSDEQAAADRFLAMRYAWRGYVAASEPGGI